MKINIKQLSGGQFFVDIDASDFVSKLKEIIENLKNIPKLQQRLIYAGKELIDHEKIAKYNIFEGRTVHLVMRRNVGPSMYTTSNGSSIVTGQQTTMVDLESQQSSSQPNIHISPENDETTPLTSNSDTNINNDDNNNLINNDNEIDNNDGARLMDVMEISRSCRLIRLFAIIDCILMILFAFWGDLLFLAGVPLAICGYFGAKNLKRIPLFIYAIFILLSIAFRIYLAYVYNTWLMIVLTIISVLLELYVLKQTISVFMMIPHLTNEDQRVLHQMSDIFI